MLLACLALVSGGELRLPALFSDHLVLQRETRAPIWGWAAPGAEVKVSASWAAAAEVSGRADGTGRWEVALATPAAGGPYEIYVDDGARRAVVHDVLVGEVWLAGGQSNMEWTLGPGVGTGVEGWQEAVAAAEDPLLRTFDVPNTVAPGPLDDCRASWVACTPASAPAFSAVAFFFARRLRTELGVPVGILRADWGGTRAEAWTSAAGLKAFPEYADTLARLAVYAHDPGVVQVEAKKMRERWLAELDARDPLSGARARDYDDDAWATAELPQVWEQHGLPDFDGLLWYRRTVDVPAAWAGRELVIELGPIDDRDTTYWNGERVGGYEEEDRWTEPRLHRVPAALVRAGKNAIAVRVIDTGGAGGFAGSAADLRLTCGSESQPLAGPWRYHASLDIGTLGWPPGPNLMTHQPSVLWNGMVAPLVPSAVRGVIFYQGEANRNRADQYATLFPNLIADWRRHFRSPELTFYFVQIAPYAYEDDHGETSRLRDAQRRTLSVPGTGMAVTMDVGDPADIHPAKKREVGERLALWALAKSYGRDLECSGPLYRALELAGAQARVHFDHAGGLTSRGEPVRHVTVAGDDHVFHPATARIEGETLVVTSPDVPAPRAVRFGWGTADLTNLWNASGLPCPCFRTDDWPE